ncbi:MAG: DHH family phosphoesterase [Tissierellia bacterium]|nr:DHH family phosphoesterase [Tissierellia bacterium]
MSKPKKFSLRDYQIYLIFIGILVVLLFWYSRVLGLLALLACLPLVYYSMSHVKSQNVVLERHIRDLHRDFNKLTEHAIFSMPFPLVVTDESLEILWYNAQFLKLFDSDTMMGKSLGEILPHLEEAKEDTPSEITIGDSSYLAYTSVTLGDDDSRSRGLRLHYFVSNEEYKSLLDFHQKKRGYVMITEVDNYEEVMDATPSQSKPLVQADLDHVIIQYFQKRDALVRKYQEDKYLVVIEEYQLDEIYAQRFDLLDEVRDIDNGNTMSLTLSIGVSRGGLTPLEAYGEADSCLDVALARGGDQAVVFRDDTYEYFGGKSKAVEKQNKVKARVLGIALRQLIDKSDGVFVMGHANPDMDSLGSAIGMLRAIENRGVKGFLILEDANPSIEMLLKRMKEEAPERYGQIITGSRAKELIGTGDLLILVDNHKPSFTDDPSVMEFFNNIVVVDHHRRGKEFVENLTLSYVEPYASSTSELVTEMITYMGDDTHLTPFESDALMSGIVVDTKNFTFRTGVRTFEAAATLRRAGADMSKVRKLFEDDYQTIVNRAEVVHRAQILHGMIAISRFEEEGPHAVLISAQAADSLLEIHGVKASFVLTQRDGKVHISGRSYGDISVQLILEKLGGGGHLNMAATQMVGVSMDEAEEALKAAIQDYMDEEMKKE